MEQTHVQEERLVHRGEGGSILDCTSGGSRNQSPHERDETGPHRPADLVQCPKHSDCDSQSRAYSDPSNRTGAMERDGVHGGRKCQDLTSSNKYAEYLRSALGNRD